MKKIYQIPETELVIMEKFCIEGPSENGGEVGENDIESNVNKTFDEGELSVDVSKSGLWDN